MSDPYSGDPKVYLGKNGWTLSYPSGSPIMDKGFENFVIFSLFLGKGRDAKGFWGNALKKSGLSYGSDFYHHTTELNEPITLANLKVWEKYAIKDLQYSPFGEVEVYINNPSGNSIEISAKNSPPDGSTQEIIFLKNGVNWQNQYLFGSTE